MMQLGDPSSSSIIPIEQPLPVEATTYMDSDLFKAAEDGDMEPINKYEGGLQWLVDGRQNTALHIYSRSGGRRLVKTDKSFLFFQKKRIEREFSINFVEQLVDKCPSLLLQPNASGEIPLHVAVRHGHSKTVKFLIERARVVQHEDVEKGTSSEATSSRLRQMLRMRDKEGNTAFHTAAESGNVDVVRLLLKELDADFSFSANTMGETPLYIAAKRYRNHDVVAEILDNCKSIDYGGPDGKTALHAAVIEYGGQETLRKLIETKKQLTKETDDKGWTPLHYAAFFGLSSFAKLLLETDASAAYITDKERGMSPLHMATWRGYIDIMKDIISHCPGCCEIVDKNGWNFIHITVLTLSYEEVLRFRNRILKNMDLPIQNLLDQKDVNGNTPVHILPFSRAYKEMGKHYKALEFILSPSSEESVFSHSETKGSKEYNFLYSETKRKQIQKVLKDIAENVEVAGFPLVKDNCCIYVEEKEEKKDVSDREFQEKAREDHLLVATLIATVTFAAAFTVPGGYKSEQGAAILSRNSAFKAFIITDTLAFVSSLLAIFLHFIYVLFSKYKDYLLPWILLADWLTFSAMLAMVIAFSTGTYAVLKSSLGFAITICSLSLIFFPGIIVVYLYPIFYGIIAVYLYPIFQYLKLKLGRQV